MCATCQRPLPYSKRRHSKQYCSQFCFLHRRRIPKAWQRYTVPDLVAALNQDGGRPLECVASALGISRGHLYQRMQEARIVRLGRHGPYGVVHWRNPRQLSLF